MRHEIEHNVFRAVTLDGTSVFTPGNAASVLVKDVQGNVLDVFVAETGVTERANPLTTDSLGRINGWVEVSDYDLTVSGSGISTYTENVRSGVDTVSTQLVSGSVGGAFSVTDPQFGPTAVSTHGAIGDGGSHPLSDFFATLADARVVYPHALALTDELDWAAIQAALNKVNGWSGRYGAGGAYSGNRSGNVFFPLNKYLINRSLYTDARIKLIGALGIPAGGQATTIKASVTGDFTAGMGVYAEKFMLKMGVDQNTGSTIWAHGAAVENIEFDCNSAPGLAGMHWWNAGEHFWLDRVRVVHSGITARTVTDLVTTIGSQTVTSVTAAFTQDDVSAQVPDPSAGYPSWAGYVPASNDYTRTDVAFTRGSDVVTSAGASFSSTHMHMELTTGGGVAGAGGYALYVTEIISGTQVRVSDPLRFTRSSQTIVFSKPRDLRIRSVLNATTAILTRPATASTTGTTVTINRPRPGIQIQSGGATLHLGKLNLVGNSGHGLEFRKGSGGTIDSVAGDNNGGALIRFNACGASGDPVGYRVGYIKAENNQYGADTFDGRDRYLSYGDHSPAILIDGCGMCYIHLQAGTTTSSERGSRYAVLVDNDPAVNWFASGFPSVRSHLQSSNPYNPEFEWDLYSTYNSTGVPTGSKDNDWLFNTPIEWNLPRAVRGGPLIEPSAAGTESWRQDVAMQVAPNSIPQGNFVAGYDASAVNTTDGYNQSNAQNDEYRWYLALSRGTWLLTVGGRSGVDRAIITFDFSIDGGRNWTSLGTKDCYAAAPGYWAYTTSSFTVNNTGRFIWRARVLTRNVSNTTGWLMVYSYATFVRTA